MPDVNDYIRQTILLRVGPGYEITDGLLAYYRLGGAASKNTVQDAELQWLQIRTVHPIEDTNLPDLWKNMMDAGGYAPGGTLNDQKLAFWSTLPAP